MKYFFILLVTAFFFSGCLKGDVIFNYGGIRPVVIVPNANWPVMNAWDQRPRDSAANVSLLLLKAKVSYQVPLDTSLNVTFRRDDDLAREYNNVWKTNYKLLPDNCYEVNTMDLTIPGGEQSAEIPVTLFADKIKGPDNYIIAFTMVSAGKHIVASNYKSIVFTIKSN